MSTDPKHKVLLTRRSALAFGVAGAASLAALPGGEQSPLSSVASGTKDAARGSDGKALSMRMPVVFAPHGGGPWPFVDLGFDPGEVTELRHYLESLRDLPKRPPSSLLVISAHWEESVPTVMTHPQPPMLYDYYGFPEESYRITWPAPGAPELASRVEQLLGAAGFRTQRDARRGFDHGTFVPFKLTYPSPTIPTTQLSLTAGLDPAEHLAIGRALAPLREEGVYILGSGMTFHNLRAFRDPRAGAVSETFDAWLRASVTADPEQRDKLLLEWANAPAARLAHPREEHLLPLMVIAGAAGTDRGTLAFNGSISGKRLSAYHFG